MQVCRYAGMQTRRSPLEDADVFNSIRNRAEAGGTCLPFICACSHMSARAPLSSRERGWG